MDIVVELYGMWRDIAGSRSVIVTLASGSTLNDLVSDLASRYGEDFHKLLIDPATGELWSTFAVAVNDSPIERAAEMGRELRADDRVTSLHPVAGVADNVRIGIGTIGCWQ